MPPERTVALSLDALAPPLLAAALLAAAGTPMLLRQRRHDRRVRQKLDRARELGSHETASLHPRIDEGLCIGCGECVRGCPEQDVLATYRHKAVVIDATECVGHGICERVCPVGAISLVVGTETRGLELPRLTEHYETSVPGLYVVGELGGMGLIRNAIWQATQAVTHLAKQGLRAPAGGVQVLVVGAGPAGLAAALVAQSHRLSFRVIEQGEVGGSMLHYPRRKLVMTRPAELPGVGAFPFREVTKEALVEFWRGVIGKHALRIETGVRLGKVTRAADGAMVAETSAGPIAAGAVVLALGRRGTPRRLDVPGEDQPKVFYRLLEPEQFDGQCALVIGGGTSALETALALAARPGTTVTLCHRRDVFAGARAAVASQLLDAERRQALTVLRGSRVTAIEEDRVYLDVAGRPAYLPNDAAFVMAGGVPPWELLKASGVDLETKFGAPLELRTT